MNENTRNSATLRASFLASARVGQTAESPLGNAVKIPQTMTLNGASAAGMLLELFGSARLAFEACSRLPMDGPFPAAQRYLASLTATEMADTIRPVEETGT
jgi:hypothetical protein